MAVERDRRWEQPRQAAAIATDDRRTTSEPSASRVQQLRALPDSDLLALIQRGDLEALEVTYDRHIEAVWSVALAFSESTAAAERAVFAAFARLWQEPAFGDRSSLAARLLASVWREALLGRPPVLRTDCRPVCKP